ncbi:hypothetical protein E4U41_001193 [Claviceps citrina]|nr:hypothetical protein E4U41_001193 [Claviceps citrina]
MTDANVSVIDQDGQQPNGTTRGRVGHRLGVPKPVQVTSVPQTPLNGSTPAEGTPRPELAIAPEPVLSAAEPIPEPVIEPVIEPIVKTGGQESTPDFATSTSHDEPLPLTESHEQSEALRSAHEPLPKTASSLPAPKETTVNESTGIGKPDMEPEAPATQAGPAFAAEANDAVTGEKRRFSDDEVAALPTTANHPAEDRASPQNARLLGKRRKHNGTRAQQPVADNAATAPAGAPPSWPGALKRKKDKKQAPVGRTARKTRSQGPVDL